MVEAAVISHGRGGRLAPELVEAFEDVVADLHGALICADHRESSNDDVEAGGFGNVETIVVEVSQALGSSDSIDVAVASRGVV